MENKKRIARKIILILGAVVLLLNISLTCYEKATQTWFYFHAVSSSHVHLTLSIVFAVLLILFIGLTRISVEGKISLLLLIMIVMPFVNLGNYLSAMDPDFYTFYSPNGGQYILVREIISEPGPGCTVYTSANRFFVKMVKENGSSYRGDIRPFRDGLYSIEWHDRTVTLTHPISSYDPNETESLCVEFE